MPTNFSHHDHCSPSPRTPVEATSASLPTKADQTMPTFFHLPSFHTLFLSLHPKDNPARVNQPEPSVLLLYSKTPNPTCQRCLSWMPPASRVSSQNSMMALSCHLPQGRGHCGLLRSQASLGHQNTDDNTNAISQWLSFTQWRNSQHLQHLASQQLGSLKLYQVSRVTPVFPECTTIPFRW